MKNSKMLFVVAALIGISAGAYLWAGHGDACHTDYQAMAQKKADHLGKKLGLSDEQKAKVKDIMAAKQQKMEEVHKQMSEMRDTSMSEIEAILTPEQKQKYEKMHKGDKKDCCGGKECKMKK